MATGQTPSLHVVLRRKGLGGYCSFSNCLWKPKAKGHTEEMQQMANALRATKELAAVTPFLNTYGQDNRFPALSIKVQSKTDQKHLRNM